MLTVNGQSIQVFNLEMIVIRHHRFLVLLVLSSNAQQNPTIPPKTYCHPPLLPPFEAEIFMVYLFFSSECANKHDSHKNFLFLI